MNPSESELRNRVAEELAQHLEDHDLTNPWATTAGANTRSIYSNRLASGDDLYQPDRADFHAELAGKAYDEGFADIGDTVTLVFTAGPPGAGKSWVIANDERWRAYRQLDADDFKDALLERALDEGLLDPLLGRTFSDGRPVQLRELSAFVHAESLAVFELLRDRSIDRGENIVLHGTLNNRASITGVLARIASKGYEHIEIAHVPAERDTALEGALGRWWGKRTASTDDLGGRFVSPRSFAEYFERDGTPRSTRMVTAIAAELSRLGFQVSVQTFPPKDRGSTGLI